MRGVGDRDPEPESAERWLHDHQRDDDDDQESHHLPAAPELLPGRDELRQLRLRESGGLIAVPRDA